MGRSSIRKVPPNQAVTLVLREVPVHADGYDSNGTYWGTGAPLFWYTDKKGTLEGTVRLRGGLDAAKKAILLEYPRARFQNDSAGTISESDIDMMLAAYMETALEDSNDEDRGVKINENYNENDITTSTKAKMRRDVAKFLRANAADVGGRLAHAGYYFWMERNGAGPSFTDGDWPAAAAKRLDKAAEAFGAVSLDVIGGKIVQSP